MGEEILTRGKEEREGEEGERKGRGRSPCWLFPSSFVLS